MNLNICIVIVSYNSSSTLIRSIQSIYDYSPDNYDFSVVLVDNASIDKCVELVREKFPNVKVIANSKNLGFGKANNLAMKSTQADFYYLHNSDAYLQRNILDDAVSFMEGNGDIGIVGFPLVYPDYSVQTAAYSRSSPLKWFLQGLKIDVLARILLTKFSFIRRISLLKNSNLTKSFTRSFDSASESFVDVDWVCGASMLIRDDARIAAGGGFDEDIFLYGEDEDLCLEVKSCGWRVGQLSLTPVIHDFGWGQHKKNSKVVARLKGKSLTYFVNKRFRKYSTSWFLMRFFLFVKRKSWGV